MSMPLPLLLALRFMRGSRGDPAAFFMIKVCFISICVGTLALTLTAAIMNGFEQATHAKLQGVHADIIMRSPDQAINTEKILSTLGQEFGPMVVAAAPQGTGQVVIQNAQSNQYNLVALQAVDPVAEPRVSALSSMMLNPEARTQDWSSILTPPALFIGKTLAQQLGLTIGDEVVLLTAHTPAVLTSSIGLESHKGHIAGIFKTGIEEFDEHVMYCSLEFFHQLFDTGVRQISIKLAPHAQSEKVARALHERFGLEVSSWRDLYPAIVSALKLEKYVMCIILGLMTLIASMNIISLLSMLITQKRAEIALLKSMGTTEATIRTTFIIVGMLITLSASCLGVLIASGISLLLTYYPIALPDAYYVNYIPAQLDWYTLIPIMLVILLLSFLASLIPTGQTRSMSIAQVLKAG